MKAQVNSRLARLVLIVLLLFSLGFLFKYLVDIEQQNALLKEQEESDKRIALKEEKEKEQKSLLELELKKEEQRQQYILEHRAVIEPELTLENTNQDLLDKYYIAVPTVVEPWTDETVKFLKSPLGQQSLSDLLTVPEDKPDFKTLTFQERTFKSLFQYFDPILAENNITNVSTDPKYKDAWELYQHLETILYPWIKPYWKSAFDITTTRENSGKKGIVMCVGNGQFKHAVVTIQSLREILKTDMPIEIFYINEWDLSQEKRDYLNSLPNVTTHEIVQRIDNAYTQFGGWDIKPYAMLASSFSEVILMDADVFLFKKPETFFEDKGYQTTGALFFLDRTLFDEYEEGRRWLKSFLPTYSTYIEQTRWWKTTSAHEQESGVVVMNKRKVLLGLLSTCKMNDKNERDKVSYEHIHGDKETFWVGFEMVQTPYAFVKSYGAVIGGLGDAGEAGTVCGNQLHLDTLDNRPWWWNGGVLRDKNRWENRYLKFTHYAEGEKWQFETSCIKEKDRIYELNEKEREIGEELIKLDKKRRKELLGNLSKDYE